MEIKRTGLLLLVLLFPHLAQAVPQIAINVDLVFSEGDTIMFTYVILSRENETISYVPGIKCDNAPQALLEQKDAQLQAGRPFVGHYTYGEAGTTFPASKCQAFVSILKPYTLIVTEEFFVKTEPFFSLSLEVCKDEMCKNRSYVFMLNDSVYLTYDSSVESITNATLVYPNGTATSLNLPTSIVADQAGTYVLSVTASKEGYKMVTRTQQFAVVPKPLPGTAVPENPEDVSLWLCNADGRCDAGETHEKCPLDCREGEVSGQGAPGNATLLETKETPDSGWLNTILIPVLIVAFLVALYLVKKHAFF